MNTQDQTSKSKTPKSQIDFQADVGRLLHIVANALYSDKEVFVRELVSNAADSCERRRIAALSDSKLAPEAGYKINISLDKAKKTFTITDTGNGMNRDDLIANLGSIASSGTQKFLASLSDAERSDVSQIGQFGVGFYSAFMIAKKVTVESRKAGEPGVWSWESDGENGYTITDLSAENVGELDGVRIILDLKDDGDEFLEDVRIRHIVQKYSDHISIPVTISNVGESQSAESENYEKAVNSAAALWTKSKSEVSEEEYETFYTNSLHQLGKPWATLHFHAEGTLDYRGLLFIPEVKPFDLFDPSRKTHIRLHVKRVFVTDSAEGLVPQWLRFLRGVIDSEDLPLQISREMLQNDRIVTLMRNGIIKRVLGELKSRLADDTQSYDTFWDSYGPVFKEGLYDAPEKKDEVLPLCRFKSTAANGWTSLSDYIERMKDGQDAIYFVHGENEEAARRSPQLEGFAARGVEVLLLTDPVDEFWVTGIVTYEDIPLHSVTQGVAGLSNITQDNKDESQEKDADNAQTDNKEMTALIDFLKVEFGDAVKDVRSSERLTTSPSCLVADNGDMDIRLEKILRQAGQITNGAVRVLEINPTHSIIKAMAREAANLNKDEAEVLSDAGWLVLDLARLSDGEQVHDHSAFSLRLSRLLTQSLSPQT